MNLVSWGWAIVAHVLAGLYFRELWLAKRARNNLGEQT